MERFARPHAYLSRPEPSPARSRSTLFASMGVFLLLSASAALSGCIVGDSANQDIANAFTPALPDPPSLPPPNPVAGCKVDRYVQPEAVITKKVDLLFLTDTSSSLDE